MQHPLSSTPGSATNAPTAATYLNEDIGELFSSSPYNNVLDPAFGADPTGVQDSTTAINLAATTLKNGVIANVYLPAGDYRITGAINIGAVARGQCLLGDGIGVTFIHRSIDFSSGAAGGIILATGNQPQAQPRIFGLTLVDAQPGDIICSASATAASGQNQITLTSLTGSTGGTVAVGMVAVDVTSTGAIPEVSLNTASVPTTVTSISGTTVTLSANLLQTVNAGNQIDFAQPRSAAQSLGSATLTPGGGIIKYPWWIYANNTVQTVDIDQVMITFTWNGVYLRGPTFNIGKLYVGAYNVGLDIDNCANFPRIGVYQYFSFGLSMTSQQHAVGQITYDGAAVAANFGRIDGLSADSIQTFTGIINITANWTFGFITTLSLDDNNSNLNVLAGNQAAFLSIGKLYSTKGSYSNGVAFNIAPTLASFVFSVDSFAGFDFASNSSSAITLSYGYFLAKGGYWWNGMQQTTQPFLVQTGGKLVMTGMQLNASAGRTDTYISQTGGDIVMDAATRFVIAAGSGGVGVSIGNDVTQNSISTTAWGGWALLGVTGRANGYYVGPNGQLARGYQQSASSYQLLESDNGKYIEFSMAGNQTATLVTTPTSTYGYTVTLIKANSGNLTISPATGEVIEYQGNLYSPSTPLILSLYQSVTLTQASSGFWVVRQATVNILPITTVSGLPTCSASTAGLMVGVSDANSPTYNGALTGGGTSSAIAYCDGSGTWKAH